MDKVTSAYLTS